MVIAHCRAAIYRYGHNPSRIPGNASFHSGRCLWMTQRRCRYFWISLEQLRVERFKGFFPIDGSPL